MAALQATQIAQWPFSFLKRFFHLEPRPASASAAGPAAAQRKLIEAIHGSVYRQTIFFQFPCHFFSISKAIFFTFPKQFFCHFSIGPIICVFMSFLNGWTYKNAVGRICSQIRCSFRILSYFFNPVVISSYVVSGSMFCKRFSGIICIISQL